MIDLDEIETFSLTSKLETNILLLLLLLLLMICIQTIVKQTRYGALLLIKTLDVVNDGFDVRAHDKSNVEGGLSDQPPRTVIAWPQIA